ncbi:DNA repair ATPase [Leminorella grimontii]|uniref:DNA repair ATPase n=1 Tax=Leminorella grimontii TaxID=82981 RepID=UPI0034CD210A
MSDSQTNQREQELLDNAVAEGGAYDILRKRLSEQGQQLHEKAAVLNARRLEEFGKSQMDAIGRIRIRTENNCVARDIVRVGDWLLFGYNVFIGLKRETRIEDVFSLYRLKEENGEYDVESVPLAGTFLKRSKLRAGLQRALYLLQEHAAATAGRARRQTFGQLSNRRAHLRHPRVPLVYLKR